MPDLNPQPLPPIDLATATVGDLRKHYGTHFAAGYGDSDPLREVLGSAGVPDLEAYLAQHGHQPKS